MMITVVVTASIYWTPACPRRSAFPTLAHFFFSLPNEGVGIIISVFQMRKQGFRQVK